MSLILDALRIQQKGGKNSSEIYLTTIKAIDVVEKCVIDRWTQKNNCGYQRFPKMSRLSDNRGGALRYLLKDLGCFPTSILVNIRDEVKFESQLSTGWYEFGKLDLGDSKLWLIDGQHRVEALKRAFERSRDFEDYPLIVSILVKPERFDELMLFYVVNKRQRSVQTDLAFRHLQRMLWDKGSRWLYDFEGARGVRIGLASEIVDILNQDSGSPWYRRIKMVGDENNDQIVDDGFFIQIIASILKEKAFTGYPVRDFTAYFIGYWNCVKSLYPEAFDEPERYTLQSSAGLYVFTMLFPMIFVKCFESGGLMGHKILDMLEGLKRSTPKHTSPEFVNPIDIDFWSRDKGPAVSIGKKWGELERLLAGIQEKILLGLESGETVVQRTQ